MSSSSTLHPTVLSMRLLVNVDEFRLALGKKVCFSSIPKHARCFQDKRDGRRNLLFQVALSRSVFSAVDFFVLSH